MAQSFNTNLDNVVKHYMQMLKVPVTTTTLIKKLTQNPYYPSLYSISDVFNKLNVANEAYRVTEETLSTIDPPFIAYCSGQNTGNDFVLVTKISNTGVSYISNRNKPIKSTRDEFLKLWQNTVFIAEANIKSGEDDFALKRKKEGIKSIKQNLLHTAGGLLLALMVYIFIRSAGIGNIMSASTIIFIKLLGISVAVLLLIYEIDKSNSFVKNICSAGKQINCNAVLSSKAAKILGMSWGEVGFFYFAATTLFLLFPGLPFTNKLPWLAIASTLASPYIAFSLYYQWKVVKQWCPLCLVVQATLAMELIWAIVYYWTSKIKNPFTLFNILLPLICCVLLIFILWYLLKPVLIAAKTATVYDAAYKRVLYNPEIFNSLLQQQTTAPDGWQKLGIDIGNPNATTTIIKVCNPYCGPCGKVHPILEEIIKNNSKVNIKVIFTASNNEDDKANKPVRHLLAIASKGNLELSMQALDEWYLAEKKDYEVFASKFPMNGELKEQDEKINLMSTWCNDAEIVGTPTFFINGKRLPETYNINELKNIF